ncbi:serine/threonine-protein kinase [Allorhodopirellula heiligendammensis]|uniref:Serine/threonine-protein kinase PknB n=1 Tax=Allorhodopirellula heiligendammensis TaxID=2714739 RepID=A0A5C6BTP3_9BACT|nr:serine/threonine-protein kinase [Allorhodopirellula heiligendammensis]TWU15212.1 Serine/threonine-protein kinase PknB [Allorhodopirellula heiligendammensis]
MESSSAIRPDGSTVHRPAPSGDVLPEQNENFDVVAAEQLESADTVIRQDPLRGSSRLEPSPAASGLGGSSRSRAEGSGSGSLRGPTHHTPASLTRELQGQRLNHFELLEQIGGGGMGAVFRAVDDRLGRTVAVKVVPFAEGDPDLQRRFRNEAQSAAKLDHPLIARVFEVGNDGPWYYIVFEYIDGRNIRDIVTQNGPLSLDDAVFYTAQVAEAIGHASRRGIVHRDIKPSNVVVTEESSIKLVDMGLARSENFDTSEDMTASGVTLGTFDYISPEQAHDPRLADIRSDLYSLGCTFYYMLTGSPPFPGGTMLQKLLNHGNAAIPDIREHRDDASDDLAAILRKMLAKKPEQRYQNSQLLIADLRELALRENLRRSRGVDVVTVAEQNPFVWRLLRHLPWVVAAVVLVSSALALEVLSSQQRREFSSQVAATVSDSAFESLPVNASTANPRVIQRPGGPPLFPSEPNRSAPFPAAESSSARPGTNSAPTSPRDGVLPENSAASNRSLPSGSPTVLVPDSSEFDNPNPSEVIARAANLTEIHSRTGLDALRSASPGSAFPMVAAGAATGQAIAEQRFSPTFNPGPVAPASAASSLQSDVAVATNPSPPRASVDPQSLNRFPSDPPSLRNFPLPIGSGVSDESGDTFSIPPRIPSFAGMGNQNREGDTTAMTGGLSSVTGDALEMGRTTIVNPPHQIRIVAADSLSMLSRQVEIDGVALATTLQEALDLAQRHHVERIEIDTPMLASKPVVIAEDDLVISSSVPGGTAIVFTSNTEVDMQRSDMLTIGSNRLELVDIHLYWTVPASETDGGAMLALNDNRRVRLTDSSITVDNPSRRDDIHAFNVVTDPESTSAKEIDGGRAGNTLAESMPLVSLELYNVIIRGQISMLRMDVAAELQLLWENGLLAVSRRMIETGGSIYRPQPKSGSIRLSLQRLTAYIPRGLLLMRLGVSTPYPVSIERQAEESVFVIDRGVPQIEITGISRDDRDQSWLRIRGASNAYETDTTLSDPLLLIRDETGQTATTTMNALADIANSPSWADDETPRWVVRWSEPLPDAVPVSHLIPADFRQDGSLFAGFREKNLPKLPMQRTFQVPDLDLRVDESD